MFCRLNEYKAYFDECVRKLEVGLLPVRLPVLLLPLEPQPLQHAQLVGRVAAAVVQGQDQLALGLRLGEEVAEEGEADVGEGEIGRVEAHVAADAHFPFSFSCRRVADIEMLAYVSVEVLDLSLQDCFLTLFRYLLFV